MPGRLPGSRGARRARVAPRRRASSRRASTPAREAVRAARRPLPGVVVPPGVDVERFRPIERRRARSRCGRRSGSTPSAPLVVGMSRLVPRKGFDVLIDAVARACPTCSSRSAAAGATAAGSRRARRSRGSGAGSRFLGRVPDDDARPRCYACADVFAMPCRDRWRRARSRGVRHRVPRGGRGGRAGRWRAAAVARTKRWSTASPASWSTAGAPSAVRARDRAARSTTPTLRARWAHAARSRAVSRVLRTTGSSQRLAPLVAAATSRASGLLA